MCEFVSWIEYKDDVFFLTNDCLRTKEGKALRCYLKDQFGEDIKGHGAIRRYYNIPAGKGSNKECTNFSTPDKFPAKIVEAITTGHMSGICGVALPVDILSGPAWAEYEKIEGPALAEYEKIEGPALAEYEKIRGRAFWKIAVNPRNRVKEWM